jgi:hypothetical protein
MWDLRIANPFGRISTRNLFLFVAATIATAFAFIFLTAPVTHAADASWSGDSITYGSNQYLKAADAGANDSRGFPKGTHVYSYVEPATSGGSSSQKAHFIYFEPSTDPTKAETAKYATFDYTPPNTYKNAADQKELSLEKKSDGSKGTSCSIPGVGWIICPTAIFMSNAMDKMYDILSQFLTVRPTSTDTNDPLYKAWEIMRNFANVAFVAAFLVIIYSQVTSFGISNYGIKKMLPRLVVAAILVNVSYWICAVAIDVSNILGVSLQDLLMSITHSIEKGGSNTAGITSWESITTVILSGGTIATGGALALLSVGSIGGALYLLLPVLVGVLISVLVAVMLMAARQALIVILVMVAPLAFVAYLLPNTEKYFERWRELFITMLMLFPIFGVIFGGSELAGAAIIQNADSYIMLILGMAVKIVPLVFLPFLVKFGGSLIGRIAGMANDRSKGLVDRTRNFSKDQAEARKQNVLGRENLRRRNVLSRSVQGMDNLRRKREGWNKVNEARADNRWHGDKRHEAIDTASREADRTHKIIEQHHDAHWNNRARTDATSMGQEMKLRLATDQAELAKAQLDVMHEEFKSGTSSIPAGATEAQAQALASQFNEARVQARDVAIAALRKKSAERLQTKNLTEDLLTNTAQIDGETLREYAGGVMGAVGAETVLSNAIASERKEYNENVQSKRQLIKHFNLDGGARQKLAMGKEPVIATKDGRRYTFRLDDDFAREAAIEAQLSGEGNVQNIEEIMAASGSTLAKFKTSISAAIPTYKLADKAAYLGGKTIDDIAQGAITSNADLDAVATRSIAQGKIKPIQLATMDQYAIKRIYNVAFNPNTAKLDDAEKAGLQTQLEELALSAKEALTSPTLKGSVAQNVHPMLQNIVDRIPPPPETT